MSTAFWAAFPFISASVVMLFMAICGFVLGYHLDEMRHLVALVGFFTFAFSIPVFVNAFVDTSL